MTSHGRRCNKSLNATAKSPHFFKIILDNTLREGKLGIPIKFVKKYGNYLPSSIFLKVPNGGIWKIELLKCGDEVLLENGWKEFSEHHSLKYGDLLVFKYEGNCNFNVLIFDNSAVEIEYPSAEPKKKNQENEILPSLSQGKKTREKLPLLPCLRSCKPVKTDSTSNTQTKKATHGNNLTQASTIKLEDYYSHRSLQEFGGKMLMCGKSSTRRSSISSNTCQALQAANNLISKYPSFKIVLRFSHTHNCISIPIGFVRMNLKDGLEVQNMTLQVEDKSWKVKLKVYIRSRLALFTAGWPAFARENSLKIGDVCIFELIKKRHLFIVSIFRY